jgi:hypothetical protein
MVAFVWTAIKGKPLNVAGFLTEIQGELKKEGATSRQVLARTTSSWKGEKPKFKADLTLNSEGASVRTYPTGSEKAVNKWVWLDEGTNAHTITARRAPTLIFQTGYTAKTSHRKFKSGPSRRFGAWRRPTSVQHPGIAAREWSAELSARRQKPFENRIKSAIGRAAHNAF